MGLRVTFRKKEFRSQRSLAMNHDNLTLFICKNGMLLKPADLNEMV